MIFDSTLWETTRAEGRGTTRYMAPELLDGSINLSSMGSDVYAFGMTAWVCSYFGFVVT